MHPFSPLAIIKADQPMTYKYYFERVGRRSDYPGRIRDRRAKQLARDHGRTQKEIKIRKREAAQLRVMIASIKEAIAVIEVSLAADLEGSRIKDPLHHAFPLSAKTMIARRDNLSTTVAALADRLAKIEVNLPEDQSDPSPTAGKTGRIREQAVLALAVHEAKKK